MSAYLCAIDTVPQVLSTLSKNWIALPPPRQAELVTLLANVAFIPTSKGSLKAAECYVPNVHLFDDLPTVVLSSGGSVKGGLEKMLVALGVRRHVEVTPFSSQKINID